MGASPLAGKFPKAFRPTSLRKFPKAPNSLWKFPRNSEVSKIYTGKLELLTIHSEVGLSTIYTIAPLLIIDGFSCMSINISA